MAGVYVQGAAGSAGTFKIAGATIAAGQTSFQADLIVDTAFAASKTQFINPMNTNWSIAQAGNSCTDATYGCVSVGMSANPVYVTLAQSAGSPIWLTAVDLAVSSDGATTAADAFQKTWNKFSGPANVKSWDGRPLYYYPSGAGFRACEVNSELLLTSTTGAGQCGSFAALLQSALSVNGISSNWTTAEPTDARSLLVVKNWGFGPGSLADVPGWPYRMFLNADFMVPARDNYGDLSNDPGLPGQNSATPSEKVFNRHFFVKVDAGIAPSGIGPYFDPSYGVWYSSESDFEAKAIDGYASKRGQDTLDGPEYHAQRPVNNVNFVNIRFTVN